MPERSLIFAAQRSHAASHAQAIATPFSSLRLPPLPLRPILSRWDLNRFADLAPAREIPFVGKSTALEGLHGLDAAVAAFEKDAGAIGLVGEGESIAAGPESGVFLDELDFRHFEKMGDRADVGVREFHKARPAAAVRAALAGVAGRGGKTIRRAALAGGGNQRGLALIIDI